jgi:hypothetical protein
MSIEAAVSLFAAWLEKLASEKRVVQMGWERRLDD